MLLAQGPPSPLPMLPEGSPTFFWHQLQTEMSPPRVVGVCSPPASKRETLQMPEGGCGLFRPHSARATL